MADVNIDANVLKDAVDLGQKLGLAKVEGVEIPYAVIPNNSQMLSLLSQKYPYGLPPRKPDHIKALVNLTDAESFCRYVKLYQDARTRVFADPEKLSFLAVLDYHGSSGDWASAVKSLTDGVEAPPPIAVAVSPEFLDHRVTLTLRKSDQWNLWMARNEKEVPQAEFAEFIEDNYRDISTPSPAEMLEVARDLNAHVDVSFASKVTPKNGSVRLAYQEIVTGSAGAAGDMEVPDSFAIMIPVFYGEKPVQIEARLRFRINGGKLKFIYKLYRPAELLADAFNLAAKEIGLRLGTDVLLGSV